MRMKLIGSRWVAVVPLAAFLGCLALSTVVYRHLEVCVPESRAALTQFGAFGDTDIDPDPNAKGSKGDCNASYTTTAPANEIFGYYRQNMSSHRWTVRDMPYEQLTGSYGGPTPEPGTAEMTGIVGERGDLCYYVTHSRDSKPPVSVSVKRTDSDSKLAPAGQC